MNKHILYLKYVLRHKWYVYKAGRAIGVGRWQLLIHDLSKFRPDEWHPYAEWFYGYGGGSWHKVQPESPTTSFLDNMLLTQKQERQYHFERAFLFHLHRNPHHHQYWTLPGYGDKPAKAYRIPDKYVFEMVADWVGAGTAISGKNDVINWYAKNKDNMVLHPHTRIQVEVVVEAWK